MLANLGVRHPHCESDQVEKVDEAGDVVVAQDAISTQLTAKVSFQHLQKPLELAPMQTETALQGVGDHTGEGGEHGAAKEHDGGCGSEQAGAGGSREQAVPQPAKTGAKRK